MSWFRRVIAIVVSGVSVILFLSFLLPSLLGSSYVASSVQDRSQAASAQAISVTHLKTPEPLKAIYMTSCVASHSVWRDTLKKLIEDTELNAVVIDIKDYTGTVSFPNDFSKGLTEPGLLTQPGCVVPDMREFVQELHDAGIYVIGRVSVFQDPSYTRLFPTLAVKKKNDGEVWKDYKGLSFIDVGARPYWDYIVELSKKAHALGFDELNYDYVRYPSDGDIKNAHYTWAIGTTTRPEMLRSFFEYLRDQLKNASTSTGHVPVLSVDLFGMTTTAESDMNIGQVLELAFPYFDYVSPMVYPSHYPPTWNGFANPAAHPYEVVTIAMARGIQREQALNLSNGLSTSTPSRLRPWLQDFNLGAVYGKDKVRAQIQATYDVGLTSWMLWSAANKYTKEALLLE